MTVHATTAAAAATPLRECWWCARPIAIDEPLITDAVGRPLHVGACAALHAEFGVAPDDARLASLVEDLGVPIGDEFANGLGVAQAYDRVEALLGFGCRAAIVWRRTDGSVELERHRTSVEALLGLDAHRGDLRTD